MTDYGRPLEFGANVDPLVEQVDLARRLTRLAERSDLDLIGIQDHPYNSQFLDTWTLLSALATSTTRIRFFPNVANLPLRPPAMLARAAASLDLLTGGRVELGLGAGAFWEGIRGLGGPARTPPQAVAAVEEAVQIMRLMWSGRRGIRFDGHYYTLDGAHGGLVPAHPIGIWLGALGPRMLDLAGRLADGVSWSTSYVPVGRLDELHARLDDAAQAAGRAPSAIRRLYNVMGVVGEPSGDDQLDRQLNGPVSRWINALTELAVCHGMDTFIFWPLRDAEQQIERFGQQIVPAVRAAVVRERGH